MIIHSTKNQLDNTCLVQVEGIPPGHPEALVILFATGAAGGHNASYLVRRGIVAYWLDENGLMLDRNADTSEAVGAGVVCFLEYLA